MCWKYWPSSKNTMSFSRHKFPSWCKGKDLEPRLGTIHSLDSWDLFTHVRLSLSLAFEFSWPSGALGGLQRENEDLLWYFPHSLGWTFLIAQEKLLWRLNSNSGYEIGHVCLQWPLRPLDRSYSHCFYHFIPNKKILFWDVYARSRCQSSMLCGYRHILRTILPPLHFTVNPSWVSENCSASQASALSSTGTY